MNLNLDEKIQKIKDRIADARDYISSDLCSRCVDVYQEIEELEKELQSLENERTR